MAVRSIAHSIVSPLGFDITTHANALRAGKLAISKHENPKFNDTPFFGAIIDEEILNEKFSAIGNPSLFTKLERMALLSAKTALNSGSNINPASEKTLVIFSTTKGNIDLIEKEKPVPTEAYLWHTAAKIGQFLGNPNPVITISNACISGTLAIITASRFINEGKYNSVIIIGADLFSHFVFSGFKAFQAISEGPCMPFDANRTGINLGEAAATLILQKNDQDNDGIFIKGGSVSNDANHISGPSRTGDGLYYAIHSALKQSNINSSLEVDYICAHGTATSYNDEMESKALAWAGMSEVPLNSLKGYFGHTLGAAGVLESIMAIDSMEKNQLYASAGFSTLGVSEKLNVLIKNQNIPLTTCLKTSSGFGSCNAAVVFSKNR